MDHGRCSSGFCSSRKQRVIQLSRLKPTAFQSSHAKRGDRFFVYLFLDSIMPLHLSANSQYSKHAAFESGRFHSAPQSGHVVLSSSVQISTLLPPQTWHLTYAGFGCSRSRNPGQVAGFLSNDLPFELNDFSSNFDLIFSNWDFLARSLNGSVYCPFQATATGDLHVRNCDAGNIVLL